MLRVGVHVSISGGIYRSFDRAKELDCNCFQIFSHSPRSWKFNLPGNDDSEIFVEKSNKMDIEPLVIHGSYLVNLATPKEGLRERSIESTQKEIELSNEVGIDYVNIHPGAHTGIGEKQGLNNVVSSINEIQGLDNTELLIENTSGSGTKVGYTFEQIEELIERVDADIGVTLDTCHAYTAGYDLATKEGLEKTIENIEETVGIDKIKLIHLNDSKNPLNSTKDHHEHIGLGEIGVSGMERIINHPKLREIPFILETPVDETRGDKENIEVVKKIRN
ncbi:Endonuclease IV Nfo [Methanonatronarchaeum thermophilum]|uniref:Probable endonuclease 4 n=1 Tax=Methanonatronarchaeum thermophilum TaxID=1927129 RepID=A0A1Y3GGM3_9EURY|nr:deoxyribonuclease IV [Methanonatronarchaeum thermophilum]OUJ19354.1 Endonuclease IV Nfo [Methanonatronarchaeum thermophilum]